MENKEKKNKLDSKGIYEKKNFCCELIDCMLKIKFRVLS